MSSLLPHRCAAVLVIASVSALAQDPGGWQKAKWGMTEAQVAAIYPGTVKQADQSKTEFSSLQLPDFTVLKFHFEVHFTFKSGRLYLVALKPNGRSSYNLQVYYDQMVRLLEDKYGEPTKKEDRDEGRTKSENWRLKTTVIDAAYLEYPPEQKRIDVIIQYRQRENSDEV